MPQVTVMRCATRASTDGSVAPRESLARAGAPPRRLPGASALLLCCAAVAVTWSASAQTPPPESTPPRDAVVGLADEQALRATLFGVPPAERAPLPADVPVKEIELEITGARPVPEVFWFNRRLRAWWSPQPGPAPLVVVIAGTGSDGDADSMVPLRGALHGAGYHVLTLPSPTFPRFIVAASSTGVAGDLRLDAADLHRALRQVLARLPGAPQVSAVHAIGYSLGGAHAAALKARDAVAGSQRIGIERVVMIGPPVSLMASVARLDALFARTIGEDDAAFERLYLRLYERLAQRYRASDALELDQEFLLGAAAGALTEPAEFGAAIALAFRVALMNMFFAGDLYARTGVVVDPANPPGADDPLDGILRALRQKPFAAYFDQVFAPFHLAHRPGTTREELVQGGHLEVIGDTLRNDPLVYAQANADDLVLDASELAWLRQALGPRLKVYPRGGHLGNLGSRGQIADLLAMLDGRFAGGGR